MSFTLKINKTAFKKGNSLLWIKGWMDCCYKECLDE